MHYCSFECVARRHKYESLETRECVRCGADISPVKHCQGGRAVSLESAEGYAKRIYCGEECSHGREPGSGVPATSKRWDMPGGDGCCCCGSPFSAPYDFVAESRPTGENGRSETWKWCRKCWSDIESTRKKALEVECRSDMPSVDLEVPAMKKKGARWLPGFK